MFYLDFQTAAQNSDTAVIRDVKLRIRALFREHPDLLNVCKICIFVFLFLKILTQTYLSTQKTIKSATSAIRLFLTTINRLSIYIKSIQSKYSKITKFFYSFFVLFFCKYFVGVICKKKNPIKTPQIFIIDSS